MKNMPPFDSNSSDSGYAFDDDDTEPMDKPALQASFFKNDTVRPPTPRVTIALPVDREVIKWFRAQGPGWEKRMGDLLRAYVDANLRSSNQ